MFLITVGDAARSWLRSCLNWADAAGGQLFWVIAGQGGRHDGPAEALGVRGQAQPRKAGVLMASSVADDADRARRRRRPAGLIVPRYRGFLGRR